MEPIESWRMELLTETFGEVAQGIVDAAYKLAEKAGCSADEAAAAIMNALNGPVNPKRARRGWDLTMAWDRKEAREKRQAVERETASRFHQRKAKESAWAVRKRTRPRQREWRGPWRGERTN